MDLTRREFEVLQLLAQTEGKVLQREEIYQAVWGYAMAHGDRSVDVFVRKVRQKLEKASPDWAYVHTHFGVGYRFQPERAGGDEGDCALEPPGERARSRSTARWTRTCAARRGSRAPVDRASAAARSSAAPALTRPAAACPDAIRQQLPGPFAHELQPTAVAAPRRSAPRRPAERRRAGRTVRVRGHERDQAAAPAYVPGARASSPCRR